MANVFARLLRTWREAILGMREMRIACDLDSYLERDDRAGYEAFMQEIPPPAMPHGLLCVITVWDGIGPFARKEIRDFFLNRTWAASPDPGWLVRRIIWEYEKKGRWEDAVVTCRFWLDFEPERPEAIQLLSKLEDKVHKEEGKQT